MKMTVEEIDNLKKGPELDAVVGEHIVGVKIFEYDEMMTEALEVWKEQPNVTHFFGGFKGENWHILGGPKVYQLFSHYSTSPIAFIDVQCALSKMDGHIQIGYISWLYDALGIPFAEILSTGEILRLLEATPFYKCRAILKALSGNYRGIIGVL